jgi:hypothetical protein
MAAGNPLGAVPVFDGENPRTFTGIARETISGGELVFVSGPANAIGSAASSYATADLSVAKTAAATAVNGIALNTVTSGNLVTVATRGAFILKAGGSVNPGVAIQTIGDHVAVEESTTAENIIGRALSVASSGNFALCDLLL